MSDQADQQAVTVIPAAGVNIRLAPGGKIAGRLAQGDQVQRAPGLQPAEDAGLEWVPVVVWVARAVEGKPLIK